MIRWSCCSCGCLLVLLAGSGCDRPSPPATQAATALTSLSPTQQAQQQRAAAAKEQMFRELVDELMKSLSINGPAKAIRVCQARAPEIAGSVGQQHGVSMGRTSFRLRNPDNQPPVWAREFVAQRVEQPLQVALPNDALGLLMPIRLQATCLMCHGHEDQIFPEVKAAVVSAYPDDEATGFSEGDLRGYFWVEVPALDQN